MNKASYRGIVGANLAQRRVSPGDILMLTLRNEDSDEGMYQQVSRLKYMFLMCYLFFPQEIAVHPDHLAIFKKQGKRLDITISEEAAKEIEALVHLEDIPRSIPMVADESLDLFTAVARFEFPVDMWKEYLLDALKMMSRD